MIALEAQSSSGLAHVIMLHCEVGDFSEGEVYLEPLLEVMRESAPVPGPTFGFPAWVDTLGCPIHRRYGTDGDRRVGRRSRSFIPDL